jgi:hypothetical protein
MFGRRRHAAAAAAPIVTVTETATPRPRLAEEQVFELVHTRIAAAIGEGGEWVVRRRTPEDTDDLFRTVLAHQVALDVTSALTTAQLQLEAGEPLTVATRSGAVVLRSAGEADAVSSDSTTVASDAGAPTVAVDAKDPESAAIAVIAAAGSTRADDDASVGASSEIEDADLGPAHRHDEPEGDDQAVLDEDSLALQWEPAPITVWTDLKKPVTGSMALQLSSSELVTTER